MKGRGIGSEREERVSIAYGLCYAALLQCRQGYMRASWSDDSVNSSTGGDFAGKASRSTLNKVGPRLRGRHLALVFQSDEFRSSVAWLAWLGILPDLGSFHGCDKKLEAGMRNSALRRIGTLRA
jgi:hypothetical protein